MSNADSWRRELKDERLAFRRQGYSDIKSKLKARTCSTLGCMNTIYGGLTCRPCLEGDSQWSQHVRHQSQLCPRCKKRDIITYGKLCPVCLQITAKARKKDLQDAGNYEVVKRMVKDGVKQTATPVKFDNRKYKIDNAINAKRIQMTMPNYKVRRV